MTFLIDIPVEGGGRLLVEAAEDAPGDLELAALPTGAVIARAKDSLEYALDQLTPAVRAILTRLSAFAPDEATVEFGMVLGADTGIVVAKGSAEVHFTVSLTWRRPENSRA